MTSVSVAVRSSVKLGSSPCVEKGIPQRDYERIKREPLL
jgi:hypothetical protein